MYIDANLTVPAQFVQSISREMVRSHFEVLSRSFNDFAFDADARIDELRKSLNDFKVELKKSDFSRSQNLAQDIANKLGMSTKGLFTSGANRQFATALKAVLTTELKSLEDFEDPLLSARGLLDRYEICLRDGQVPPYISISSAVEHAKANRTEEMKRKIDATSGLLLEFFGDVSLDYLSQNVGEFFRFLHRLPRDHGQKHGKNRHIQESKAQSKQDLIDAADAHDREFYDAVRSTPNTSLQQQRAELPDLLTIRMAHANLERHLDRIHDVLRHAAAHLGYTGPTKLMGYSELKRRMKTYDQELAKEEPLFIRLTRPKRRTRWSNQRMKTLLTSPVYRGCKSSHRRSQPGKRLIRDAIYWVPLIVLFMGTRLTEVLQLKARDLILHSDGVFCLRLAWSAEQDGKTEESQREVPIPEALIELGFVEWIKKKGHNPNNLLFPEIYKNNPKHTDQTFTKRFQTVRKNLNILSHSEDFYALRMSL